MGKRRKAFTLVELLTVIAVISILAGITVLGYTSFIKKAYISNDTLLVEQLNKFKNIYSYKNDDLTEYEISEIIKKSGIDDIVPQSQKYGYGFYFNTYSQRFELLHTSSVKSDEQYMLIDEEFLQSDHSEGETDKDDIDPDASGGGDSNSDMSENEPNGGENKEDREDKDNKTDTSDKSEADSRNDSEIPSTESEPNFVLGDFEKIAPSKHIYISVKEHALNVGIYISDEKTQAYIFDLSQLSVIDEKTGKCWSVIGYMDNGHNAGTSYEFNKCGRFSLTLILSNDKNVERAFEIPVIVRNTNFPQDAKIYIDCGSYEIHRNGDELEIILGEFRKSVEITDYNISTEQIEEKISLSDNKDLRDRTTLTITFNGTAEKVDINNNIDHKFYISENYDEDITVTITVSYIGANGIDVSSSVTYVNGRWVDGGK